MQTYRLHEVTLTPQHDGGSYRLRGMTTSRNRPVWAEITVRAWEREGWYEVTWPLPGKGSSLFVAKTQGYVDVLAENARYDRDNRVLRFRKPTLLLPLEPEPEPDTEIEVSLTEAVAELPSLAIAEESPEAVKEAEAEVRECAALS